MSEQPKETAASPECASVPNSVLGKTFSILSAFDGVTDSLRLVELSRRTGVPKPSVYRLAQELLDLGLLERVPGGYRLGFGVYALGQRVTVATQLRAAARPVVVDLCAATRSTVHLAVLEQNHAYYLEKMGGIKSVHVLSSVGGRLPLTCTASGKLLLATAPHQKELLAELGRSGLDKLTPRSASNLDHLRRELAGIRDRRFATEQEEALLGFKSFAVPVSDASGSVIAALSSTVPVALKSDKELLLHLWGAASAIGRRYTQLMLHDEGHPNPDGSSVRRHEARQQRAEARQGQLRPVG